MLCSTWNRKESAKCRCNSDLRDFEVVVQQRSTAVRVLTFVE
jgi:hypothetical protein